MPPDLRIGIDLGGTKIEGVSFSGTQEGPRRRQPTPRHDYPATIQTIVALVRDIEQAEQRRGTVGIGIPGAISPATGLVKNANSTWLNGKPFKRDLEDALGRPVRLANDADCFTLSEATDGAAKGYSNVFGVILGTGVGGGIVIGNRLVQGRNAITGEWGHNSLPWPLPEEVPGPACYCGRNGCIESWISGPGFSADDARANPGSPERAADQLIDDMRNGDPLAIESFARFLDRLARSLAHVVNLLDPHCIVLGGGLSNIDEIYTQVKQRLPAYVFSDRVDTDIVRNRHGDSSGVRGAAWLWNESDDRMERS